MPGEGGAERETKKASTGKMHTHISLPTGICNTVPTGREYWDQAFFAPRDMSLHLQGLECLSLVYPERLFSAGFPSSCMVGLQFTRFDVSSLGQDMRAKNRH